jgi:hypothetical protein
MMETLRINRAKILRWMKTNCTLIARTVNKNRLKKRITWFNFILNRINFKKKRKKSGEMKMIILYIKI